MVSRAYFISQSTDFQHADNIISVSCLNKERGVEGRGGGIVLGGKRHGGQLSRGQLSWGAIDLGGNSPGGGN